MPTLINKINGIIIEFDEGRIDNWCVYIKQVGKSRHAPKDEEIFTNLRYFGVKYGLAKIYSDFVKIYELTYRHLDPKVINLISKLAKQYKADSEIVEIWYTVVYAGMIAEENKKYAKLKKRIKRLGIHQLLLEGLEPVYCGSFSRGKKWRELDKIMVSKGF